MKEGQQAIYYISGEDIDAVTRSPQLEGFRKRGVEVLLLPDRIDEWVIGHVTEFDGKPLKSAAQGSLDVSALGTEAATDMPPVKPS